MIRSIIKHIYTFNINKIKKMIRSVIKHIHTFNINKIKKYSPIDVSDVFRYKFRKPYSHPFGHLNTQGERGGSVVESRTPEREVGGSRPTAAVMCPWARHFTPRKYWLITQEAVAPSRHDWKIVDWDVKPQHKQTKQFEYPRGVYVKGTFCVWCYS